jgi:pyruvate kinase
MQAGMSVARLNFSHGAYDDHAQTIRLLREVSEMLDMPITLLQDLQGPKVRVGHLPEEAIALTGGDVVQLVPVTQFHNQPGTIPIDYPHLAEEAEMGMRILLDDGLLELTVTAIAPPSITGRVVRGGMLKSRKGVNVPSLNLRLPSLTEKDRQDLEFGLSQGIDWVALSFVRSPDDIQTLKACLRELGASIPVLAKIEKPQAIAQIEAILAECDGIMVARGDLGVEMNPEKVPALQKQVIRRCNQKGIPVITATQMLESMIQNPRPTRAEASDVANAIIDGTDAVMLSGESAVGAFPVQAVEMLGRIAAEIEPTIEFTNHPPDAKDETHAISEALTVIDKILDLKWIAAFTTSGYTARLVAAERPRAPILAFTSDRLVYGQLNLLWGVRPILLPGRIDSVEHLVHHIETTLRDRQLATSGDQILILGGSPVQQVYGTNFIKIHTIP